MNPSPSRRTQSVIPEEQSALLSSHEHDNTPEPGREPERGSSGPAWQVWRRLFQQSGEDGLPTLSTTKRQAKRRYDQALLYALLIFIGIGVGVVFGRRIERRSGGEGLGDGPLVVPIFEFPPVRCLWAAELTTALGPPSKSCVSDQSAHCSCR